MATYLRDLTNSGLFASGIAPQSISTTTTGSAQDFLHGDGRCHLLLHVGANNLTSLTVRVQESTLTNSGFADISGASVSAATTGSTAVAFDRTKRYLQAVAVISGTTGLASAQLLEQYKVI